MTDWFDELPVREQTIWLAAIMDGKGNFNRMNGSEEFGGGYPRVQIDMLDLDTMKRIARMAEVDESIISPRELPSGKVHYRLQLLGDDAIRLMNLILPFMSSRRAEKIRDVLEKIK